MTGLDQQNDMRMRASALRTLRRPIRLAVRMQVDGFPTPPQWRAVTLFCRLHSDHRFLNRRDSGRPPLLEISLDADALATMLGHECSVFQVVKFVCDLGSLPPASDHV